MIYKDNFKILNKGMIADPTLAVFVRIGRVHEEEEGWWVLHISHDPEMSPSAREHIDQWKFSEDEEASGIFFPEFSSKSFSFFEFMLRKVTKGKTLAWELMGSDEDFRRIQLGSAQCGNLYECPENRDFLLYVFKNILLIPELLEWGYWGYTKAEMRISAQKFAYLSGQPLEDIRDDVVWDEREVETAQ